MKWLHENLSVDMAELAYACEECDPSDVVQRVLVECSLDWAPVREIAYLLGAAIINQAASIESECEQAKRLEAYLLDEMEFKELDKYPGMRDTVLSFARARPQEADQKTSILDAWEEDDCLVNLHESYVRAFNYAKIGVPVDRIPLDGIGEAFHEETREFIRRKLKEEQSGTDGGTEIRTDVKSGA